MNGSLRLLIKIGRRLFDTSSGSSTLIANLLGATSVVVVAAHGNRHVAAGLALATLALIVAGEPGPWLRPWCNEEPAGKYSLARLTVVFCALMLDRRVGGVSWHEWMAGALLLVTLLVETSVIALGDEAYARVANLPTYRLRSAPLVPLGVSAWLTGVASVLALAGGAWGLSAWPAFVVALLAFGCALATGLDTVAMFSRTRGGTSPVTAALNEYAPVFVLYWQAPPNESAYQVAMWLPYLQRLGVPFFVLVRTSANFAEVTALTDAPVVHERRLEDLDRVVVPSLRTAFYVNTAVVNCHLVRYVHLTHIQLNHGDSDKMASTNQVFRMFDRNFVAGQAAIDRFEHNGVAVPKDMFEIVGRPQVAAIRPAAGPISAVTAPTVMYAPTWAGFYVKPNYSSLRHGRQIVKALLDRGCTVIFRSHPFNDHEPKLKSLANEIRELLEADVERTGRPHLYGAAAETDRSIVECFNLSDALVSDVSSVPNDFLYSEKPFAMVAVSDAAESFADEFPIAQAAYVIDAYKHKPANLGDVLDQMLGSDPVADRRRDLKVYYLGDFDPEERFLQVARTYL